MKSVFIPAEDCFIIMEDTGYVFKWQFESEEASDLFQELHELVGKIQAKIPGTTSEDFMDDVSFYATEEEMLELWDKYKDEYELGLWRGGDSIQDELDQPTEGRD